MAALMGTHGELVDRLVAAVDSPEDNDWIELGWFMAFMIGGKDLHAVAPDTGHVPAPGTVGARERATHRVASRQEYMQMAHRRLMDLIDSGLREDLLVRAVRDELTHVLQEYARTEDADTRREETRSHIEQTASNPEQIAAFRDSLARVDPEASSMSDDEIAGRLREMAMSDLMQPTTQAQMQAALDRLARWRTRSEVVSDLVLADWQHQVYTRMTGDFLKGEA